MWDCDGRISGAGDFEDETPDWDEDGLQKLMVDYYGSELETTVFTLAHHGADYLANKPVLQGALKPLAIFASADTDYRYGRGDIHRTNTGHSYRHVVSMFTACLLLQLLFYLSLRVYILLSYKHPRCSVFDGLTEYTQSICKPTAAEGDEYYYKCDFRDDKDAILCEFGSKGWLPSQHQNNRAIWSFEFDSRRCIVELRGGAAVHDSSAVRFPQMLLIFCDPRQLDKAGT